MHTILQFFFNILPISFYACGSLCIGISCAFAPYPIIIGLLCIGLLFFWIHRLPRAHIVVILAFLLFGFLRTNHQTAYYNHFPFHQFEKPATLIGTITGYAHVAHPRFRHAFIFTLGQQTPWAGTNIQLYTKKLPDIQIGDQISLHEIALKRPSHDSYKNYLMKEGITCSVFLESINYSLLNRPALCLYRSIHNYRQNLLQKIRTKLSYKTFALFSALFLGEKKLTKSYLEKLSNQFKEWGITHFLARSGLHLVIFIVLWELLLSLIPLPFLFKQLFLCSITLCYFLLSWPTVSFFRALLIFTLYKCCALLSRPSHFLHTLCATCCIILIFNPMQLFFLDFQLTFALTGALAWLALQIAPKQPLNL